MQTYPRPYGGARVASWREEGKTDELWFWALQFLRPKLPRLQGGVMSEGHGPPCSLNKAAETLEASKRAIT